jgi:2-polyprenyl-6-methoxyphenol hydroxylase-like FAD-dependent oxidoreductase
VEYKEAYWISCEECKGLGKKSRKFNKKAKTALKVESEIYLKAKSDGIASERPNLHLMACPSCNASGLVTSSTPPIADTENFPHIAIIGSGIGGVALAVACLHRGIPFTLYERDTSFDARSQGYGLTLQQASKALIEFGINSLKDGVNSTRHIVHTTDGNVIGEWGKRMHIHQEPQKAPKRTNVHIARQSMRLALLDQLGLKNDVKWGHQLFDFKECEDNKIELNFLVNGEMKKSKADLVVGSDGIRSTVRNLLITEESSPLCYLGCIVILGICPLASIQEVDNDLLDSATVFQTANGNDRIYIMPYTADSVMWQLSFPMTEEEAKVLSAKGTQALKEEATRRTNWHSPIPQIVSSTKTSLISGYPAYDRALLKNEMLKSAGPVTLIGDAAHPMSPFKGQGANQALLDALSLARTITKVCRAQSHWRESGLRLSVLNEFESEMLERSAIKVISSKEAANFLHSDLVLQVGNEPRGRHLRMKK